jgi:hypothetical protein
MSDAVQGVGAAAAGAGCRPTFFLIGARKGGTTSFYQYLLAHPGIHGVVGEARALLDRLPRPAQPFGCAPPR